MERSARTKPLTRRQALRLLASGAAGAWLAACGMAGTSAPRNVRTPQATSTPARPSATGPVALRAAIWADTEAESNFWQQLIVDAGRAVGNVVTRPQTSSFDAYWTWLPAVMAEGAVPEVLGIQSVRAPAFVARGLYRALDGWLSGEPAAGRDDLEPVAVTALMESERLYGVPFDADPAVVFLNISIFEQAGRPTPPPEWTWQDLLETARALPESAAGAGGAGLVSGGSFEDAVPFIFSNGGDYASPDFGRSTLGTPATVEALALFAQLQPRHQAAPHTTASGAAAALASLQDGRAAMYLGRVSRLDAVRRALADTWDLTTLPRGRAGSVSAVVASGFGVSASAAHPEAAWAVVRALTSAASQRQAAAAGHAYPARRSAASAFARQGILPRHQQRVGQQLAAARPLRANLTWQAIVAQLQRTLMDPLGAPGLPVEEAVRAAEPGYQRLLDRAVRLRQLFESRAGLSGR